MHNHNTLEYFHIKYINILRSILIYNFSLKLKKKRLVKIHKKLVNNLY